MRNLDSLLDRCPAQANYDATLDRVCIDIVTPDRRLTLSRQRDDARALLGTLTHTLLEGTRSWSGRSLFGHKASKMLSDNLAIALGWSRLEADRLPASKDGCEWRDGTDYSTSMLMLRFDDEKQSCELDTMAAAAFAVALTRAVDC